MARYGVDLYLRIDITLQPCHLDVGACDELAREGAEWQADVAEGSTVTCGLLEVATSCGWRRHRCRDEK